MNFNHFKEKIKELQFQRIIYFLIFPFFFQLNIFPSHSFTVTSFKLKYDTDLSDSSIKVYTSSSETPKQKLSDITFETFFEKQFDCSKIPFNPLFKVLANSQNTDLNSSQTELQIPFELEYQIQNESQKISPPITTQVSLIFTISPSISVNYYQVPVLTDGLLLQLVITNNTPYIFRHFGLDFFPDEQIYIIDEKTIEIIETLLPQNTISSVLPLEIKPSKTIDPTCSPGSVKFWWSIMNSNFSENDEIDYNEEEDKNILCRCEKNHKIDPMDKDSTIPECPIQIQMIGSPQIQSVVVPFPVKLNIHNKSKNTSSNNSTPLSFTVNIDTHTEANQFLKPYKNHSFKINNLAAGASQNIDVQFIGLDQGLLKYPNFQITIHGIPPENNSKYFEISQDIGVLILREISY